MVELKSTAAIEAMAAVGVTGRELDTVAHTVIRDAGALPVFLHYHPGFAPTPFPAVICASVNDVIVHGIPSDTPLRDGNLVSIDCGAELDGWVGDAAISFTVGTPHPGDATLIDTTAAALAAGIVAAVPGNRLGDIAAAIGRVGRTAGYGIPRGFGGHGIGRRMHEDPSVPNDGQPGRGMPLREGLVLALEPMFCAGGRDSYYTAPDGWGLHTTDGSRAAHVEHTVAITADGPRILITT
ncbi:type I methionyl aminopeptidase [Candidatus Frankia alpina]|uniref:type I methionyl aminopeptidase n=1 Tax=Candidatus Frankia alpina TaxID=2699483 RepID=UPI0013D25A38|nr:type I methionyl aminopeptidase [Candidatus Frankia alpina]